MCFVILFFFFFFQAEDGIRDWSVTGVQTCALPILEPCSQARKRKRRPRKQRKQPRLRLVEDMHAVYIRLERPRQKLWPVRRPEQRSDERHGGSRQDATNESAPSRNGIAPSPVAQQRTPMSI